MRSVALFLKITSSISRFSFPCVLYSRSNDLHFDRIVCTAKLYLEFRIQLVCTIVYYSLETCFEIPENTTSQWKKREGKKHATQWIACSCYFSASIKCQIWNKCSWSLCFPARFIFAVLFENYCLRFRYFFCHFVHSPPTIEREI